MGERAAERPGLFMLYAASDALLCSAAALEPHAAALRAAQAEEGIVGADVALDGRLAG